MKPAPFRYADPGTLDEALAVLADEGEGAKVLAGGQSLLPLLSMRLAAPTTLVDINRVPGLDTVEATGDGVTVGALVRHNAAAPRRRRRPGPAAAGPGDGERRAPGDPQPRDDGRLDRARRPVGRDDLGPRPHRRLRLRGHAGRRRDGRLARPLRRPAGDLAARPRRRHLRLLPGAAAALGHRVRRGRPPQGRLRGLRRGRRRHAGRRPPRRPPSAPPTSPSGWCPRCTT